MVCFFWCLLSVQTTYSAMCKIFILGDSHGSSTSTKNAWRLLFLPSCLELLSMCLSLVPRPSHCPVLITSFDCLQYAKWGRPGPFYHVNDIDVYLDKQRGEGHSNRESAHFLCSVQQAQLFFCFVNILNSNTWINTTRNGLKHALLSRSPSPSLSR